MSPPVSPPSKTPATPPPAALPPKTDFRRDHPDHEGNCYENATVHSFPGDSIDAYNKICESKRGSNNHQWWPLRILGSLPLLGRLLPSCKLQNESSFPNYSVRIYRQSCGHLGSGIYDVEMPYKVYKVGREYYEYFLRIPTPQDPTPLLQGLAKWFDTHSPSKNYVRIEFEEGLSKFNVILVKKPDHETKSPIVSVYAVSLGRNDTIAIPAEGAFYKESGSVHFSFPNGDEGLPKLTPGDYIFIVVVKPHDNALTDIEGLTPNSEGVMPFRVIPWRLHVKG